MVESSSPHHRQIKGVAGLLHAWPKVPQLVGDSLNLTHSPLHTPPPHNTHDDGFGEGWRPSTISEIPLVMLTVLHK